jgi:hypothetical protein
MCYSIDHEVCFTMFYLSIDCQSLGTPLKLVQYYSIILLYITKYSIGHVLYALSLKSFVLADPSLVWHSRHHRVEDGVQPGCGVPGVAVHGLRLRVQEAAQRVQARGPLSRPSVGLRLPALSARLSHRCQS